MPRAAVNDARRSVASGAVASNDTTSTPPTRTSATRPAGDGTLLYGTPRATSAALATSQLEVNLLVPTGLNCTEQSAGSAATTTGARSCADSSAGLA